MYYAQINPDDKIELLNPSTAYPGSWDSAKVTLEGQGYLFVEIDKPELPGTHYDREKGAFYTPTPPKPAPTITDQMATLSHKLDEQAITLMQIGMLAAKLPEVPDAPPDPKDLPAGETPLPDADTLKGLMGGATPPEIPS